MYERVLVTGGLGFIGSAYVRRLVSNGGNPFVVDLGTYAADKRRLENAIQSVQLKRVDVASDSLLDVIAAERPHVIVHFAAESHVTRSETTAAAFWRTNVEGTRHVMEGALRTEVELVVHISTDEVYGPCYGSPFRERDKALGEGLATSAYARSKAVADDLARSYADRMGVVVARLSNCIGPWQYPEKAVPRWITRALTGRRLPVWGDGGQIRDWMFVGDSCVAIDLLVERGSVGEVYNIAPEGSPRTNLEIARTIARASGCDEGIVYLTAYDRPHHDRRYSIDASKMRALGWNPRIGLEERLAETVEWYRAHRDWWEPLVEDAEAIYQDERERKPSVPTD